MANLENKNTNPLLAAIANFCCLGCIGYFLIGQTKKAVIFLLAVLALCVINFIGYSTIILPIIIGPISLVLVIFTAIDIHALATAVAKGEAVDEHEYRFEILYKLVKSVHPEAVFNAGGGVSSATAEVKVEEPAAPEPEPTPEPEEEPEGEDDKKE